MVWKGPVVKTTQGDIKLNGKWYNIDRASYKEVGPSSKLVDRQMYQVATGELDFGATWPYTQRSWLLGEQQSFTHEYDEMKTTAIRRYEEGHGIDNMTEGQVGLLKSISRSLELTTSPTTCPMCGSVDGTKVYAFPAGGTKMYTYTKGSGWDSGETVTGATAPITDCTCAGDGIIYVVDSADSGSKVRQRSTAGSWSQVTVTTASINLGVTGVGGGSAVLSSTELAHGAVVTPLYNTQVTSIKVYLDGGGASGDETCTFVIYKISEGRQTFVGGSLAGGVTVTSGQAAGWVTANTTTTVSLEAGQTYWVGVLRGAAPSTIRVYIDTTATSYEYVGSWVRSLGSMAAYAVGTYTTADYGTDAYDTAEAVVWINGELYVITPTGVYDDTLLQQVSDFCGGTIGCSHDGALYWSDGSNRVYEYNGIGVREVIGQLPPGFTIQYLFSAHSRLWICGRLSNGDAGVYWYSQSMYGILAYFPAAAGGTRDIYAGAATNEYVLFSDSRYGGTIQHYVPEGGWSHYLAYGSAATIPYKGLITGAGKTFIVLATGVAGTQGIYCEDTTYIASGTLVSSQMDLQMPAHTKRWTEMNLQTLPLRVGEKILVEVSPDGGRTFYTLGYMDGASKTSAVFGLDYESATLQYRLTLYAGTSQLTDPRILSVTARGIPVIPKARQWTFRVKGRVTGPGVSGRVVADLDARTQELIDDFNESKVLDFEDLWGNTARVSCQYERVPAYDGPPNAQMLAGSLVQVILQEQPV